MSNTQGEKSNIEYRMRYLTPEEKAKLVVDYGNKMPIAEIMEKYKISKGTIYYVLKQIKRKEEEANASQEEE